MAASVPDVHSVKARALQIFAEKFNEQAAVCVYAPGRVNLIGEHTDYNEGFVLPIVNSLPSFSVYSFIFLLFSHPNLLFISFQAYIKRKARNKMKLYFESRVTFIIFFYSFIFFSLFPRNILYSKSAGNAYDANKEDLRSIS